MLQAEGISSSKTLGIHKKQQAGVGMISGEIRDEVFTAVGKTLGPLWLRWVMFRRVTP